MMLCGVFPVSFMCFIGFQARFFDSLADIIVLNEETVIPHSKTHGLEVAKLCYFHLRFKFLG